jgi:hypothetical protein
MTGAALLISLPGGHIAGIPVEETLGSYGPGLLVVIGAALATVRAGWRRVRRAGGDRDLDDPGDAAVSIRDGAVDSAGELHRWG